MTQPAYPYQRATTRAERRALQRADVLGNGTVADAAAIAARVVLAALAAAVPAAAFATAAVTVLAPVMPS